MNLQLICQRTCETCLSVGEFIRQQQDQIHPDKIENKGIHDFVTSVDKIAEKKLVEQLKKIVPEAGFIAEEGTETQKGDRFNWVIDPLDGTTNYIHGLSPYAISIALMEKEEVVLGVVYEIGLKECFYSWKGAPVFLNEKPIRVSVTSQIKDCLIATGFPYTDYKQLTNFMKSLEYFILNTHGVRRPGSAATDLAYVACGRFDAFYEYSLNVWDVAVGAFLVEQAGGKVCDFTGGKNYLFGAQIIASNYNVHEEFKSCVQEYMI